MTEANERPLRRFPFLLMFLSVLVLGGEYFFAVFSTFQLQSALRGGTSADEANYSFEKKMNDTLESLVANLHDTSLTALEQRITSLEDAFESSQKERLNDRARLTSLRRAVVHLSDQVDSDEERLSSKDVELLDQRLSSIEKKFRTLKEPENKWNGENEPVFSQDETNETFCVPWETVMDHWWTHHPDWYVSDENNTHYCFSPMEDPEKAAVFQKLYDVQFNTDCSNVTTKRMWSSGWGADFQNVVDGLKHAYETGIPTQVHVMEGAWHYAGKKDASRPVCDSMDMYCYFLNMTKCEANPEEAYEGVFMTEDFEMNEGIGRWLLEYATRQQTWLRHEVYKFSKKTKIKTPCAVMHVRRADVVLHQEYSRQYRQVSEYIEALDNSTKNILLLTDDQNAVEEAQTLHPDYNWMFLDRPRHRGAEGGWENQIPSDDPKLEVIILLSIFRLVKRCSSFVHAHSNFAFLLEDEMQDGHKHKLHMVNLDQDNPDLWNEKNSLSVNLSKTFV